MWSSFCAKLWGNLTETFNKLTQVYGDQVLCQAQDPFFLIFSFFLFSFFFFFFFFWWHNPVFDDQVTVEDTPHSDRPVTSKLKKMCWSMFLSENDWWWTKFEYSDSSFFFTIDRTSQKNSAENWFKTTSHSINDFFSFFWYNSSLTSVNRTPSSTFWNFWEHKVVTSKTVSGVGVVRITTLSLWKRF